MNKRTRFFLACVLFLSAVTVFAGMGYSLVCRNPSCRYKTQVAFGGSRMQAEMTGYCLKCRDFVSVHWNRGSAGKKATPPVTGMVWNPASGRAESLFRCPKCTQNVLAIGSAEEIKRCPRCGKDSLTVKVEMMFD